MGLGANFIYVSQTASGKLKISLWALISGGHIVSILQTFHEQLLFRVTEHVH